jgi:hypothetical protein
MLEPFFMQIGIGKSRFVWQFLFCVVVSLRNLLIQKLHQQLLRRTDPTTQICIINVDKIQVLTSNSLENQQSFYCPDNAPGYLIVVNRVFSFISVRIKLDKKLRVLWL